MRKSGFTVVDLSVALAVVAVAGGLFILSAQAQSLDAAARARGRGQFQKELKDARNIQLALATYGTTNKDWYPGVTSAGKYMKDEFKGRDYAAGANAGNDEEVRSGAGCAIAAGHGLVQAMLLEELMTTPGQWISPGERDATVKAVAEPKKVPEVQGPEGVRPAPTQVGTTHSSLAMLAYGRPTLKAEWKCTTSQQAIVVASRMVFGEKQGQHSSLWTPEGSGRWRGGVVRNDGSAETLTAPVGQDALGILKYGAVVIVPSGNTANVVGLFGKHTDMANFGAVVKEAEEWKTDLAQLGSAVDGVKEEKKEEQKEEKKAEAKP